MGYEEIVHSIDSTAQAAGRHSDDIRLLAVSKKKSSAAIRKVYGAGQRYFAENYADELLAKAQELRDLTDLKWVYIGQLQSNKIQKLMSVCSEIQTVASEKHARYIERYAGEQDREMFPIWIHVNAEGEQQKFGLDWEHVESLSRFIKASCPHLQLQGLMSIPPANYNDATYPNGVPELYKSLRDRAAKIGLGKLSLGMSSDLQIAIRAGSNCLRIGTAIFGARD